MQEAGRTKRKLMDMDNRVVIAQGSARMEVEEGAGGKEHRGMNGDGKN